MPSWLLARSVGLYFVGRYVWKVEIMFVSVCIVAIYTLFAARKGDISPQTIDHERGRWPGANASSGQLNSSYVHAVPCNRAVITELFASVSVCGCIAERANEGGGRSLSRILSTAPASRRLSG